MQHVVEELDELIGAATYLRHRRVLRDGGQILAHVMRAAAGRGDDVVEARKVLDE